jgi:hypothetical protein
MQWLQQPKELFALVIHQLEYQWDAWLNIYGDYF